MHVLENMFFCAFKCFIRRIQYSYEVHIVHITLLTGKCREKLWRFTAVQAYFALLHTPNLRHANAPERGKPTPWR